MTRQYIAYTAHSPIYIMQYLHQPILFVELVVHSSSTTLALSFFRPRARNNTHKSRHIL